jgi:hypothetical protein
MSRRWSGTLNFSMSAPDMKTDKVMTRAAARRLSPALIAPGFCAGCSRKNRNASKLVDLPIIAGDGKYLR